MLCPCQANDALQRGRSPRLSATLAPAGANAGRKRQARESQGTRRGKGEGDERGERPCSSRLKPWAERAKPFGLEESAGSPWAEPHGSKQNPASQAGSGDVEAWAGAQTAESAEGAEEGLGEGSRSADQNRRGLNPTAQSRTPLRGLGAVPSKPGRLRCDVGRALRGSAEGVLGRALGRGSRKASPEGPSEGAALGDRGPSPHGAARGRRREPEGSAPGGCRRRLASYCCGSPCPASALW
jgi:hypothetical protein